MENVKQLVCKNCNEYLGNKNNTTNELKLEDKVIAVENKIVCVNCGRVIEVKL